MRTGTKLLLVMAAVIFVAGIFGVASADAQGNYLCKWNEYKQDGVIIKTCDRAYMPGLPISCDSGYQTDCKQFRTRTECENNPHQCELQDNKYICQYVISGDRCITAEDSCSAGRYADCSSFDGDGVGCKGGQVQTCETGYPGQCTKPEDCEPDEECVFLYAFADGTCQPKNCDTDADCNGGAVCVPDGTENPADCAAYGACGSKVCKPPGTRDLNANQSACAWNASFLTCMSQNTCGATAEPGQGTTQADCQGKTKEECENTPIVGCEYIKNWGTKACFQECTEGTATRNTYCNRRCDTNFIACGSDQNCVDYAGLGEGWQCRGNVCEFTGRTGFDCRSGGLIPCGGLDCPCTFCHIFVIINRVVDLLIFTIAPILVSIMVIVGGFFVMTSRGAGQLRRGKEFIKWAILGYLLMLIAWVLVNTILTVLDLAEWVGAGSWWDPTC